jgi:hypothetical protein
MEYNEREACGLSDHLIADKYYDFYGDAELLCTGEGKGWKFNENGIYPVCWHLLYTWKLNEFL